MTPFHVQVVEAALDHLVGLVIVDTAADVFGGNENDRSQVRQFISRALGSLAIKINGAVVLCAHPSRAALSSGEGDSGSGWSNTLRSRLFISAPAEEDGTLDADVRILERRKANYAARRDVIRLAGKYESLSTPAPQRSSPQWTSFWKRPMAGIAALRLRLHSKEAVEAVVAEDLAACLEIRERS